jgi:S-adenosyl-L-methionine hydrolase (adenosine-forming)
MRPVVTLLTDFGLDDTFVGQMKGVMLGLCPSLQLVDLTHSVPPQSVVTGAVHLRWAWCWFPEGTIHIAVVDPGVGSDRRAIAFRFRGHIFIGPDNGLLALLLGEQEPDQVVELSTNGGGISNTFHGRDVFAVAAGRIAAGDSLLDLGHEVPATSLIRLEIPEPVVGRNSIEGEILLIDHYGNAMTNIRSSMTPDPIIRWNVQCGEFQVERISSTYADVQTGQPLALVSSMNTLEIAVRDGSAAARYDLTCGMQVRLTLPNAETMSKEATT